MRKIKLIGKTATLAILAVLFIGVVSAALLQYYGQIQTTITAEQSVLVDGKTYDQPIIVTLPREGETVYGGDTICVCHNLTNRARNPISVILESEYNESEVSVKYYKCLDYGVVVQTGQYDDAAQVYPIAVTVEDLGEWIQWTFDFFAYNTTPVVGDGHFAGAVIISLDGSTPAFQIHNNDGACSAFDFGTWLYSPYDPTGGGWYGWHTGEADWNTPVDELWWVEATGARDFSANPEGKLIVKIHKLKLGETFYWAVYANQFGFYNPNNGVSAYPEGFAWGTNEIFEKATILEEITAPLTLEPEQTINFVICYELNPALIGETTIVTRVTPAP